MRNDRSGTKWKHYYLRDCAHDSDNNSCPNVHIAYYMYTIQHYSTIHYSLTTEQWMEYMILFGRSAGECLLNEWTFLFIFDAQLKEILVFHS